MALPDIRQPSDLRDLTYPQLDELSGEIRDFIVHAVSEHAGHLGSNLGVVELSLALHRVFESPTDSILWDTGHQAYIHKIVTGRQEGFARLRQSDGLSGYPNREESQHDWIENSHASTVLSYAYGLAVGRDLDGNPLRHIVAVIGDGSMTGGMPGTVASTPATMWPAACWIASASDKLARSSEGGVPSVSRSTASRTVKASAERYSAIPSRSRSMSSPPVPSAAARSEERRVGKERRSRWSPYH